MRWKNSKKTVLATILMTLAFAAPALPAEAEGRVCRTVEVPITGTDGSAQSLPGSLCTPGPSLDGVHRIDVLIHGGTYSSIYWDWPLKPEQYSYARKTNLAGRATFTYNRPGTVAGQLPPSSSLSATYDAGVLHQIVQWLRPKGFDDITLIGHSLGSIVAITETAAYNDANRLVVTGLLHHTGDQGALPMHQASQDPKFAGTVTDPNYITTVPGTRGTSFYDVAAADPDVIAYDEDHKDVMSADEAIDGGNRVLAPAGQNDSNKIHIPVLVVIGQQDRNFCGTTVDCSSGDNVRAAEAPYYTSAPALAAVTVPDTGHSITLHPSADTSFAAIDRWIKCGEK